MAITSTGTELTFNNGSVQTVAGYPNTNPSGFTSNLGTVTSVATGNGLQGGTITSTGTLSVACPGFNTVGSYVGAALLCNYNSTITSGSNYAAGGANLNMMSGGGAFDLNQSLWTNNLSGTWKWMGLTYSNGTGLDLYICAVACRVS